jgi:hypothetical protein
MWKSFIYHMHYLFILFIYGFEWYTVGNIARFSLKKLKKNC